MLSRTTKRVTTITIQLPPPKLKSPRARVRLDPRLAREVAATTSLLRLKRMSLLVVLLLLRKRVVPEVLPLKPGS